MVKILHLAVWYVCKNQTCKNKFYKYRQIKNNTDNIPISSYIYFMHDVSTNNETLEHKKCIVILVFSIDILYQ